MYNSVYKYKNTDQQTKFLDEIFFYLIELLLATYCPKFI